MNSTCCSAATRSGSALLVSRARARRELGRPSATGAGVAAARRGCGTARSAGRRREPEPRGRAAGHESGPASRRGAGAEPGAGMRRCRPARARGCGGGRRRRRRSTIGRRGRQSAAPAADGCGRRRRRLPGRRPRRRGSRDGGATAATRRRRPGSSYAAAARGGAGRGRRGGAPQRRRPLPGARFRSSEEIGISQTGLLALIVPPGAFCSVICALMRRRAGLLRSRCSPGRPSPSRPAAE